MKKRMLSLCVAIVLVLLLAACSQQDVNSGQVEITDMNGDVVSIPSNIERVICRSGNGTSFLVAMGLGNKLVGTADYVVTNPWVEKFGDNIADLSTFGWAPSSEEIYAVGGDLVMLADPEVAENLRADGINAICYKQYNEEEIIASARLMGDLFGEEAANYVEKWIDYYNETDKIINSSLSGIDETDKPLVYYVYAQSNKGLGRTSGGGSIEQFWIEDVCGIFSTDDLPNDGPTITIEEAIVRNPEVIFIGGIYSSLRVEELRSNPEWADVSAVKNNRIYQIPIGFTGWDFYGVEFPMLKLWAAQKLYPELIDVDMHVTTKQFYKDFYGVDFSDKEIDYILSGLSPEGTAYVENR